MKTKVIIENEKLEELVEMHLEWTKDDDSLSIKDHYIFGLKDAEKYLKERFEENVKCDNCKVTISKYGCACATGR